MLNRYNIAIIAIKLLIGTIIISIGIISTGIFFGRLGAIIIGLGYMGSGMREWYRTG